MLSRARTPMKNPRVVSAYPISGVPELQLGQYHMTIIDHPLPLDGYVLRKFQAVEVG